MGNNSSLGMEPGSNFNAVEIRRLAKRFTKLDSDSSGTLSVDELKSLPELRQNPLLQRIIDIFDEDGSGEVDFREFIRGISQFSVKGNEEPKLRFLFRIYDIDNDGFISNKELFQFIRSISRSTLNDMELQHVVDKTILMADKDGDMKINFDEFCCIVANMGVHRTMNVVI